MDRELLDRFCNVFFSLLPNYILTPEEIKSRIEQHGYDGFLSDIDDRCFALIEAAELLSMPEKGGRNGS